MLNCYQYWFIILISPFTIFVPTFLSISSYEATFLHIVLGTFIPVTPKSFVSILIGHLLATCNFRFSFLFMFNMEEPVFVEKQEGTCPLQMYKKLQCGEPRGLPPLRSTISALLAYEGEGERPCLYLWSHMFLVVVTCPTLVFLIWGSFYQNNCFWVIFFMWKLFFVGENMTRKKWKMIFFFKFG